MLEPGKALYSSLNVATGTTGWNIAEPGIYTIQVALHMDGEDVVSNPLKVRVAPPRSYDEEFIAQDFFSNDVGRVLTFNGSRHLASANDTLQAIVEQFGDKRAAYHARLALGNPLTRAYKLLNVQESAELDMAAMLEQEKRFKVLRSRPEDAQEMLINALIAKPDKAADTLGHIEYTQMVRQFGEFLDDEGEGDKAATCPEYRNADPCRTRCA